MAASEWEDPTIIAETTDPAPPDAAAADGAPEGDRPRTATVGRARWTIVGAVAGGLLVGFLAAVVATRLLGGDGPGSDATAAGNRTIPGEVDSPDDLLPEDVPIPAGAGAASADAALRGFLDAEVAGDYEGSFGYLADGLRADYLSPAGWVSAHADVVPPILGYEIGERTASGEDRALIQTVLSLAPGLDQVVGLTPAEAVVEWDVVRGSDGWGVSLETSPFRPVWPDDAGAEPAARAWAEQRQQCESPENERTGLIGSPVLADSLCDAGGAIELDAPQPLDDAAAQPFFSAYGADAAAAARSVRISGAAELGVVLVPIGDDWTVIGVIP